MKSPQLQQVLTLIILIAAVAASFWQLQSIPPKALDAPETEFSASRAMEHMTVMAQNPHPAGSAQQDRVRDYLLNTLQSWGLSADVQVGFGHDDAAGLAGYAENVLVRIPGKNENEAVLFLAHSDSHVQSPGAGDDISGTAVLLESVHTLLNHPQLENDLIILFTDSREYGSIGALAFLQQHPWIGDVRLVVNLEASMEGPATLIETNDENGRLIRSFARYTPAPRGNSWLNELFSVLPYDSDFLAFKTVGYPGYNLMSVNTTARYHTAADTISAINPADIQQYGEQVFALMQYWGNQPLDTLKTAPANHFNLLRNLQITFPQSWSIPILIAIGVLFIILLARAVFLKQFRWLEIFSGFGATLILIIGFLLAGNLLWRLLLFIHPQYRLININEHLYNEVIYFWAFTFLSLFGFAFFFIRWRSRISTAAWLGGSLLLFITLGFASALLAPGFTYLFIFPALAAMLNFLSRYAFEPQPSPVAVLNRWLSAVVIVLVFIPFIYLFALGIGANANMLLPGFIVLVCSILSPVLALVIFPRPVLVTRVLLGISILFLLAGSFTASASRRTPLNTRVQYFYNTARAEARWIVDTTFRDRWTRQFIGENAVAEPLEDFLPPIEREVYTSLTDIYELPEPVILFYPEEPFQGLQQYQIEIQFDPRAHQVAFYFDPQVRLVAYQFDGHDMDYRVHNQFEDAEAWKEMRFIAPQEGKLQLGVTTEVGSPLRFWILTHRGGLPAQTWDEYEPRPPEFVNAGDLTTTAVLFELP